MVKPHKLLDAVQVAGSGKRLLKCFLLFCRRWHLSSKDKIMLNFAAAAFHLCYLLEVDSNFFPRT
jgi:hypothetical protein